MPASSLTKAPSPVTPPPDDRREWIRIDDNLLLEYRLLSDSADVPPPGLPPVTPDVIASAVGKPTADLLARSGEALTASPLLPWVMKVDWLLEAMLKTLATLHPECMAIARVTSVNISGGGISFVSLRQFAVGDQLALKVILPPFTPIQTVAKVIRAAPSADREGFSLATEFVDLRADDQEHLIRHILHAQAERLRARRAAG